MKTRYGSSLIKLLLLWLVFARVGFATNAGGIVGAGAVWRLADSPIYVTSDVQIPSGVTLTIEPGVHVVFTGAYQILVQGAVSAAGTAGAPITFGPLTAGTNCGATVLKFEGTDLALSSLAHIKVEGVKYAIRIGEEDEDDQGGKNTGTLTVGGMTASDAGILTDGYETGASLLIKDIDFDGVDVVGNYPRSEAITLDGGFFLDGTINSGSYNHGIALKSLALVNASVKMGCCGANVTLDGCDVLDSSFSDYNDDYSVTIRSSLVRSTSVDLGQAASVVIADSMFVFDGGPGIVARNLQMSHSSVWGAHGALTLLGSGNAVEDCTFCDNDGVIVYASQASGAVSGSNLLLNAGLSLDNRSAAGIAAAGNFWGVGTAAAIEALVRHHNDDINFGLAGFSPFLLSPNPGAPISRPAHSVKTNVGGGVHVEWDANPESDVAGYRLHFHPDGTGGYADSVDVDNVTSCTLGGLTAADTIAITAYDAQADGTDDWVEGHESWHAVVNDPAPEIAVTPASLDFSVAAVGTTATLSLAVENPGTGTLTVSAITSSKAAFSASPAAFTVAPGASRTVAVTFAPASIGAQSATLSIASDAGAAKTVALSGFGAPSSGSGAGGIVGAGAVWRLADSPIYVTSDVQIPSGVTLTIEPGVHVVFTGAYQILVQGAVSAAGTAGAPITFGPLTAGTNCGATVLKFEGTDLALSSLAHIKVEGVKYAIRIGEEDEHDQGGKNTGTLTVGGMTASDAGILTDGYETGASLLIKDIDFDGVDVVGNYPRSEAITLDGGFFLDGTINSDSYNHGIALKSLALVNASVKMGCCGANVTLDGCDVLDSSFSDYNDDYSVTIRSSLVRSTSVDLGQAASVVIADSMFVFDGGPGIVARNLQMSHSSVWGAHGALTLLGSGNAVEDCTFCDNDGVIVYASQASGAVSGSNLLLNAGLSLDNRSAAGIAAAGNFWGVGTAAAIEALVRHHNDDINFGLAGFSPFLLSPNPGAPISRPAHSVKTNVGGGVHVEWDANPESDVAGYRLHFHPDGTGGYADSVDVDNVTSCTLGGLTAADTIAITAYDAQADGTDDWVEGHESWHAVVNDPAPEIAVTPASLDFSVAAVGTTATLSLAVENPGTGTLTVSAITSSKAAFSASPAAFTVAPGASRTVAVTFAPASIGAQSATLSIASDAGAAKTVALSGFGAPSSGSGAGGIVGAGAVWRLADSPIYVTSDVQIPSGVTLTIEPGVHVVFTGAYQILVQGAVSAAGTAGAPITFGPLTAGTNCGATVLKFEGTDLALSSLAHIKVEGVKYAIRIGEEDEDDQGGKNTGTLTVGGMTASDAGILTDGYETGASLLIKDIDFDGVDVVGNYPRSEAITLDGGFFLDGTINSDSYNHGIALKSLALVNASVKMGCCGANVTLDGCDVLDSSFSDYNDDYSVTIRSSLVRSTSVDLGQAASVVIADSMFVFDGGPGIVARNLQMSHSSVWGAHGALTLLGSGNAVEDCTFCDNDGVIVYASQASGAVSGSNLLLNAGLSLDNRSAAGIAAAGNFWGVGTAAAIEALVRHHNDDINFGLAGFSPFLLSPNPGAPISRPLVVQQVINDDLSRDLYWSRGLEADVAGYRVHYSTDDSIDSIYHSVNAGDLTHLVTNPSSAIDMLAVTAYDNDANGVNDQAEGHESWYTFAETVKTPDWFKLRLQPKLSSDGMISNVARQYCPVRVLSWTLPPAVYPGQSVDSIIRVEYSDDNMPSGNYDRASLISASVYGDWAVESAQATLVAGEAIGAPRIVEFPFTFTAPEDSGKKTLRYALASNASSAGSGFDIANYYGQDSASGVGPYCEATFEVLPPDAPPLSPTHLEASSGAQSVLLTWKPNTESNLKNYCIYRSLEDDSGTADRIDTIAMNDCRYLDENVEINKTYYYWITAINALDKESGFSNRASATPGEIVMSIDDYHGAPGDEVHLMVSAENAAGVSGNGLDVVLTYDTRLLTPLTVSTTALTHNFTLASNASADTGQINITGVALNGALIQGRGALLDVSFTVKDGLEPGESGNHAFVQVKMYNSALNSLAVDYSDQAVFTVSESYVLGDVNGDGEIDSLDALMALQHAAGLRTLRTSPPEFQAADINKDGVVDAADVTLILQMAVGLRSSMLAKMSRQKASAHLSGSSPHIQLYVPAVAAMPGKTIEVPLYFSGETGFSGLDLSLIYDPRVLKLQSVARGDFCADFSLNSDMMQGAPSITLSRVANIGAGKGVVAVFKFLVIGQLGEQSPLNISRRKFSGENGENLDYASDIATTNGLFYLGANIFNAADDWMNYR